jgi:hypothetical protein
MCSASVWSPIRMIDIGTNQQYSSFLIYSANGEWKLLYQQIDGILIDNFVSLQPNTYYELIELTKDVIYPQVLMTIKNPYYVVGMTIETAPVELGLSTTLFYTVLGKIYVMQESSSVLMPLRCFSLSVGAASGEMSAGITLDSGHTPIHSIIIRSQSCPVASILPSTCRIRNQGLRQGTKFRESNRGAIFIRCG